MAHMQWGYVSRIEYIRLLNGNVFFMRDMRILWPFLSFFKSRLQHSSLYGSYPSKIKRKHEARLVDSSHQVQLGGMTYLAQV
jgi:hypothetical protein